MYSLIKTLHRHLLRTKSLFLQEGGGKGGVLRGKKGVGNAGRFGAS